MFLRLSFLFTGMLILGTAAGQVQVFPVGQGAAPESREGLFYALPRTVVHVTLTVERIENYKGPYAEYAQRYLGLQNVVPANGVEYRLAGVEVTTSSEPDPEHYYFVQTGEKFPKGERAALLALSESGLIIGSLPDQRDTVSRNIRIIREPAGVTLSEKDVFPEIFKYYADISVFEKVDTIIRKISMDTLTMEKQILKRTMVEKSPEQKAREAADFISKIKENRFNLLTGYQEVSYNQETLEYMDTQLKILEKEYMKLFTGISIHKTETVHFTFIPLASQLNREIPLCKFRYDKGIMALDVPGGQAVTIQVQRTGSTSGVSSFLSRIPDENREKGFYYRIPEFARIMVTGPAGIMEETQCLVNQLGVISVLPVNRWKVRFHEQTGGISGVIIE